MVRRTWKMGKWHRNVKFIQ